ncbi:MAG: aldo/keto reductase [Phycisphaerae bacterium]|nr:aldo/keto reductase [Phycisphaerae bacterium]
MSRLPTRPLGRTGVNVTVLGLGGVTYNLLPDAEAAAVVHRAIDLGIGYIDTAHSYKDSEQKIGQVMPERRDEVFLATKTTSRTRAGMAADIEESLKRLRTDRLDCVQLHDFKDEDDLRAVLEPDGALKAIEQFRADGTVRFVGITGHRDPDILARAMAEYPFDTVLCALGAVHGAVRPFAPAVLSAARQHGVGVVGMKVMAYAFLKDHAERALRYVMGLPDVATAVVGMDNIAQVEANVAVARACRPLSSEEEASLLADARVIYEARAQEAWFVKFPTPSAP